MLISRRTMGTHIDQAGSGTGVLPSGTPAGSQNSPPGNQNPGTGTPPRVCVYNSQYLSQNYFTIEEMWHFCIMGRGRKGLIEQSERKTKSWRGQSERRTPMTHFFVPNREVKQIFIPQEAFEFMKNMNPQHLVDFLLPNDDWHVKTLSGNASGSWLNIRHGNSTLFTQAWKEKYFMQNITF